MKVEFSACGLPSFFRLARLSRPHHPRQVVKTRALDRFAIFLSGLCLIHCLAIPMAILFGAVASNWLISTETSVHWILLGLAAPVSIWALYQGYRQHASILPLAAGSLGLGIMFLGVSHLFGHDVEVGLTVSGVVVVLIAHLRNVYALSSLD